VGHRSATGQRKGDTMRLCSLVVGASAILLPGLLLVQGAHAQSYPTKPVRMIVPFPAGGGSDTMGRALSRKLEEGLRQRIVVENRVGAAGSIGADLVAKAAPDGYTILLGSTSELTQYPNVNPSIPYDPIRDFAPISLVGTVPLALVVHPSLPVKSVQERLDDTSRGRALRPEVRREDHACALQGQQFCGS
jgi:tripartite-type tricarboxylate transporter receptor subunit TctC